MDNKYIQDAAQRAKLALSVAVLVACSITAFRATAAALSAASFPSWPVVTIYGSSVDGRPLVAYTFGDGPNSTAILCSIHGNERNTRPLGELLIAYLKTHPTAYAGCTVTVVPCVNPDGWANSTRVNAHGVDLNRNFPVGWKPSDPQHLKRGSKPLSEPESAALAKLIAQIAPSKIVSIHNPLHMLDYSGAASLPLANAITAHDGYPVPKAGVGYPTPGSFGQYCEKLGIAIVTLELPKETVDDAWDQNADALLAAIHLQTAK
jgi:murein peptide amidase A